MIFILHRSKCIIAFFECPLKNANESISFNIPLDTHIDNFQNKSESKYDIDIVSGRYVNLEQIGGFNNIEYFVSLIKKEMFTTPGLLKILNTCPISKTNHFTIVEEFSPNYNHIQRNELNPTGICKIMFGIAAILNKLNENDIIYNELEPENVLIDENFEPKLRVTPMILNKIYIYEKKARYWSVFRAPLEDDIETTFSDVVLFSKEKDLQDHRIVQIIFGI